MKQKFDPEIWLVERKPFDPSQWLDDPAPEPQKKQVPANYSNNLEYDVEIVVQRIEESQLDLTCNQGDWVKLGFAFASEFGEVGRKYFHRICRFYSGYSYAETDQQFNKCLRGERSGSSIKSFFFAAKQAGINVFVKPQS
ncbi:PriCT-2 domain-containing protein [Prolixibacteraceae bacterium Z1-6]|uniref:PriCT-2 domain-containing protein n=1 Tax=Draconibacterium aestuarii TaxID=2998507 RepID=A0A9X3F7A6_9BACT|nr:PriCT-2 domain-containing protein [Prolixibacteraceae bacterium Z1-6]